MKTAFLGILSHNELQHPVWVFEMIRDFVSPWLWRRLQIQGQLGDLMNNSPCKPSSQRLPSVKSLCLGHTAIMTLEGTELLHPGAEIEIPAMA